MNILTGPQKWTVGAKYRTRQNIVAYDSRGRHNEHRPQSFQDTKLPKCMFQQFQEMWGRLGTSKHRGFQTVCKHDECTVNISDTPCGMTEGVDLHALGGWQTSYCVYCLY